MSQIMTITAVHQFGSECRLTGSIYEMQYLRKAQFCLYTLVGFTPNGNLHEEGLM